MDEGRKIVMGGWLGRVHPHVHVHLHVSAHVAVEQMIEWERTGLQVLLCVLRKVRFRNHSNLVLLVRQ